MTPPAEPEPSPLRFADVMEELAQVHALAAAPGTSGYEVAEMCLRLEVLFARLQSQFMRDVVTPKGRPA